MRPHVPSNWRCHLSFLKTEFWKYVFFYEIQEKRKIPVFSNGSAPSSGETPKEAAHHAGPELQRTGRWVQILIQCGCLFETRGWFDEKDISILFLCIYLGPNLVQYYFHIKKKCLIMYRYMTSRKINTHFKIILPVYTWVLYTLL